MKRWTVVSKFFTLFCLFLVFFATTVPNSVHSSNTQSTGLRVQLCLILDGSSSLTSADWNVTRDAIANVIANMTPRDSTVELTLVEFGYPSSDGYAKIVVTPTVVTNASYSTLASQVMTLMQGGDGISTAAGIYLAWLALKGSPNFATSSSHVFNLVTEHLPAVRNYNAQAISIKAEWLMLRMTLSLRW
jgi:hypothetical protein